ncbi:ribonuclease III domain-containing protein [Emericellopsis atlantica]|uniref:Ribonuclease III domain-containing protein n=1 Tax=Emericellopsis atlantica TaxID=2614577 RepID=A0A9P8CL40_9HYPO|nr:ribonuclease III domain-containing protein [Emericellopsis atlantica]KAG9250692.1 ribonuclease III domain-containing protein [Emericellopsis atlantica]
MDYGDNSKIDGAAKILAYEFQDPSWLWEALQAAGSSVSWVNKRKIEEGNKRLAGLGDRIISMSITDNAVEDNLSIGENNALLQARASNSYLASTCDNIGLTCCINGNPSQQGAVSARTKATTVEATIGAVYKDGGLSSAEAVMRHLGMPVRMENLDQ